MFCTRCGTSLAGKFCSGCAANTPIAPVSPVVIRPDFSQAGIKSFFKNHTKFCIGMVALYVCLVISGGFGHSAPTIAASKDTEKLMVEVARQSYTHMRFDVTTGDAIEGKCDNVHYSTENVGSTTKVQMVNVECDTTVGYVRKRLGDKLQDGPKSYVSLADLSSSEKAKVRVRIDVQLPNDVGRDIGQGGHAHENGTWISIPNHPVLMAGFENLFYDGPAPTDEMRDGSFIKKLQVHIPGRF